MSFLDPLTSEPIADLADIQDVVLPKVLVVVARFLGLAVFVMLMYGGLQWLTASGDPKKVEQAKNTITGAIIGIVFLVVGWFALNLLNQLLFDPSSGFDLTIFDICITPTCL